MRCSDPLTQFKCIDYITSIYTDRSPSVTPLSKSPSTATLFLAFTHFALHFSFFSFFFLLAKSSTNMSGISQVLTASRGLDRSLVRMLVSRTQQYHTSRNRLATDPGSASGKFTEKDAKLHSTSDAKVCEQ